MKVPRQSIRVPRDFMLRYMARAEAKASAATSSEVKRTVMLRPQAIFRKIML
jgi:hypothetical protein